MLVFRGAARNMRLPRATGACFQVPGDYDPSFASVHGSSTLDGKIKRAGCS
jgi:hypothetical protein